MDMEFAMDMHYERAENAYTQALDEADKLRRQRDEALQALRDVMQHKDSRLSTDVGYIGICQKALRILAQYDKDGDA